MRGVRAASCRDSIHSCHGNNYRVSKKQSILFVVFTIVNNLKEELFTSGCHEFVYA